MRVAIAAALFAFVAPRAASAHGGELASDVISAVVWLAIPALAACHAAGTWRQWPPRQAALRSGSFLLALALIALALLGPVADGAASSFAGHMVQHMVLLLAAPPLLVFAKPLTALLRALPTSSRSKVAPLLSQRVRGVAVRPVRAALLQAVVVSFWHIPSVFVAAERNAVLHELEHASFILAALLYWQGQFDARGEEAAAVLASLIATIWCGFLGALLTFAPAQLFATSLEDQQLAGLLMWIPCSFVYLAGALVAFALWVFRPGRQWV